MIWHLSEYIQTSFSKKKKKKKKKERKKEGKVSFNLAFIKTYTCSDFFLLLVLMKMYIIWH